MSRHKMVSDLLSKIGRSYILNDVTGTSGAEYVPAPVTFGAVPSHDDDRDFLYRSVKPVLGVLPKRFMLPEWPANDQGNLGTCVGQAASAGEEYDEAVERKKTPGELKVSPDYIYAECKQIDGIPDKPGTYGRTAMKVLNDYGAVLTSEFPPLTRDVNVPAPPASVRAKADKFRNVAYAAVETIDEIRHAIMTEGPVLGCFIWVDGMLETEDGFLNMPRGWILGGHAISIVGWDMGLTHTFKEAVWNGKKTFTGFFRIRNSWGKEWGDNGYAWLPMEMFKHLIDGMVPWMTEGWSAIDRIDHGDKPTNPTKTDYFDVAPTIIEGRTMVELRNLAEILGAMLEWDGATKRVTLTWPGVRRIVFHIGKHKYTEEAL